MPKPNYIFPALYGGVIIGVMYGVPYLNFVNCCCCAGVLAGGVLAVFFYKKDLLPDMPPLDSSDALKVGALAGAIGGVIGTVLGQVLQLVSGENVREELEGIVEQIPDAEGGAVLEMLSSFVDSPFYLLLSLISSVIICTIFGTLGGLIGYAIFKPKQPMVYVQPPTHV